MTTGGGATEATGGETGGGEGSGAGVQSLARGLAVVRAFDAEHPEMTLSDVARKTGLSRATARRFLLTLVELGYVRTDGKVFALTARVLELGYRYLSGLTLPELALPHLEQLAATVGESTSASVLDATDIVYVARVPTKRIMSVAITIGTRFPAAATSMGRVLLASLPPSQLESLLESLELPAYTAHTIVSVERLRTELALVREQGWALTEQELELGLRSLAMPVKDARGRTIAAINVSGHAAYDGAAAFRERVAGALAATVELIEQELRHSKPISRLLTTS